MLDKFLQTSKREIIQRKKAFDTSEISKFYNHQNTKIIIF